METFDSIWPTSDVPSHCISIYDGTDVFLRDFSTAGPVHETPFAAYWPQAEILKGGLNQFFGNSTGVLAPEAVEAYKILGMPQLAAALQDAMDWFGVPYPRERVSRKVRLEEFAASHEFDPFDAMDDKIVELICEESSGLEAAALGYLRRQLT